MVTICGIAGFSMLSNKRYPDQVDKFVSELLNEIDSRGGDACGYLAVTDGGEYFMQKAACDAKDFNRGRKAIPRDTRTAILHTRYATQGHEGFVENNHPVYNNGIYCTHNGVIANDYKLFYEYDLERNAVVDTEIIPAMVGHYGWESGFVEKALEELDGYFAVALVDSKRPKELILARGPHAPLWIMQTDDWLVWASELVAIRQAWGRVFGTPPAIDKFEMIEEGTLLRKLETGEVVRSKFSVPDYAAYGTRKGSSRLPTGWSDMDDEAWGDITWVKGKDGVYRPVEDSPFTVEEGLVKDHIRYQYATQAYSNFNKWYVGAECFTAEEIRTDSSWERVTDKLYRRPKKATSRMLEAAAIAILEDRGLVDQEQELVQCHICGGWDDLDERVMEEGLAYCYDCIGDGVVMDYCTRDLEVVK